MGGNLRGGSSVKVVARGRSTLDATVTNVTISAVNTAKSIVVIKGFVSTLNIGNQIIAYGRLTSSTNIAFTKETSGSIQVDWEVVEFSAIRSLQVGLVSMTSNQQNYTISSVITNKSALFFSYIFTGAVWSTYPDSLLSGFISNATQLSFDKRISVTATIQYYVVEF